MKYRTFKRNREENAEIAKERIQILEKMKKRIPEYSLRYDELIAKIVKKYRLGSFKSKKQ